MAHTWTVATMDYDVTQGDNSNVVTCVHWRCTKVDGDHTGSRYGSVGLEAPSGTFVEWGGHWLNFAGHTLGSPRLRSHHELRTGVALGPQSWCAVAFILFGVASRENGKNTCFVAAQG